jgi:nucleotide-binding universal stress UspA family protein
VILIGFDGSETARRAIAVAHDFLGDVEVTVLHAWEPGGGLLVPDPFSGMSSWNPAQVADLEAVIRERAGRLLAEGVSLAGDAGFTAQGRLETSSSPWRTIVDVAGEIDASLVVLGTHGASAVRSVLLGSVSNAVSHHLARPLLLVPGPATS